MNLWLDEVDYTESPEEFNPELVDERLAELLKPTIPFSVDRHLVVFHDGVGFII